MASRRHVVFNLAMIIIPWLSLLLVGKHRIKRYSLASIIITIFEILNHIIGHKRKFWVFYDKPKSFLRDELPFDIGPYFPVSIWLLRFSFGNFKMYVLLNTIAHAVFAFLFMPFLKKIKILRLHRLSYIQFFLYIHYKAYILYGIQYLVEKIRRPKIEWNRFLN